MLNNNYFTQANLFLHSSLSSLTITVCEEQSKQTLSSKQCPNYSVGKYHYTEPTALYYCLWAKKTLTLKNWAWSPFQFNFNNFSWIVAKSHAQFRIFPKSKYSKNYYASTFSLSEWLKMMNVYTYGYIISKTAVQVGIS